MTTETLARPSVPPIAEFPTKFVSIPAMHRGVLALIAAHGDKVNEPARWLHIVGLVKRGRLNGIAPFTEFRPETLRQSVAIVLNDLDNLGVVDTTGRGLVLSEKALAVRSNWNGEFSQLVEEAAKLL